MTVEIRLAEPSEYDKIGELTAQAYLADGVISPASDYLTSLRDAADRAANADLWVAAESSAILGSVAFCGPGSAYRELAHDDEGEFRMLAVAPAARGKGVGSALAQHCLRLSEALDFRRVVIGSAATMATAHRMYRRLGFLRLPERDWSPAPGVQVLGFVRDL